MSTGKYTIPQFSDIVERDRLFSFLDLNRQKNVFLILGQAAQGKSTLIASYLSMTQNSTRTLWLHLGKSESDHTKLFYMLFNAFSKVIGNSKYFKNLKIPQTTLGVGEDIARYSEILISLFNIIDQKINIVIDDIDSLDENASSFSLIQNIITDIPINISLFLLSRQMPVLAIEKLKMDQKMLVLNNEDIAFTLEETQMFFSRFKKTEKIDLTQIKKIQAVTEGWAGGLTLVSESMRRSPDLTKLPEHIATDAFSFFSEEIYLSLPEHIKNFLMKTSFFEVLDPEVLSQFCEDIPDPVQILKELEKRNLFIQRVDSSGKWPVFRYNKLFRTFLKRALLRDISQDQFKKLNIE
ncbi:MAG: protein MalT, partial [Desulfobacteraceae bacterium]|nr:protein MalT [Desulfobacteraceae bacterium]